MSDSYTPLRTPFTQMSFTPDVPALITVVTAQNWPTTETV